MLWHKLSELPVVTIAKIRGRARGAGASWAGVRHAVRRAGERHPGADRGRRRHDPRRGRRAAPGPAAGTGLGHGGDSRADDFSAEQAERYGWINRALPDADLDAFVARLGAAHRVVPRRRGAIGQTRAQRADHARRGRDPADARRFHQLVTSEMAEARTAALFTQGLQTRGPLELDLGDRIGAL